MSIQTRMIVRVGLVALLLLGCAPDHEEVNKETVRNRIESIDNRDFEALDDLVAPNIRPGWYIKWGQVISVAELSEPYTFMQLHPI